MSSVEEMINNLETVEQGEKKERHNVSFEEFVRACFAVHKEGGGYSDLAKRLNRDVSSIRARYKNINKKLAAVGESLPELKENSVGQPALSPERMKMFLAKLRAEME